MVINRVSIAMKAPYVVFGNESENYAGNVGIFGSNSLLERYIEDSHSANYK